MSKAFFDVFKKPSDHKNWGKQIEFIQKFDGLGEPEKSEYIAALSFFEKELGKGFLKSSPNDHPFQQKINNRAPWQIRELIDHANTLSVLKSKLTNYPKLIKKLSSVKDAKAEGFPFLEIAGNHMKENLEIEFIEEEKKARTPDMLVINPKNNDKYYIELSELNLGERREIISHNHHFIFNLFNRIAPFFFYTGIQKKVIEKDEYPDIEKIIKSAKERAHETGKTVSYLDERIEFWIFPEAQLVDVEKFCESKRMRENDVRGLPLNLDEISRLQWKIDDKAKQIPFDKNGIIYFVANALFFLSHDIDLIFSRIENYLARFPNIIGIVIYSKTLEHIEETNFMIDKHYAGVSVKEGALCRRVIYIHNYECNLLIDQSTFEKIYATFR